MGRGMLSSSLDMLEQAMRAHHFYSIVLTSYSEFDLLFEHTEKIFILTKSYLTGDLMDPQRGMS